MNSPIFDPSSSAHYGYSNALWYAALAQLAGADADRFSCLCPDSSSPYGTIERRKSDYVKFYVTAISNGAPAATIPVAVCDCGDFETFCCANDAELAQFITDSGLDLIAPCCGGGGGGGSNLGYTAGPAGGTVTNDGGTDATIPVVNNVNAGLAPAGSELGMAANSAPTFAGDVTMFAGGPIPDFALFTEAAPINRTHIFANGVWQTLISADPV